jgi:hypothetical protein
MTAARFETKLFNNYPAITDFLKKHSHSTTGAATAKRKRENYGLLSTQTKL